MNLSNERMTVEKWGIFLNMYRKTPLSRGEKKYINVHMLLTFCIRITNYQDFIFTYLAANCIHARAHLPEALLYMFKNPAIIKIGRKLPPDENCRRCSTFKQNIKKNITKTLH